MKNLDEAAYKGNIGVMELAKFHSKASPAQKSKFTELMRKKYAARNDVEEKRVADEIWDHVQTVTGVKLAMMESTRLVPSYAVALVESFSFPNTMV